MADLICKTTDPAVGSGQRPKKRQPISDRTTSRLLAAALLTCALLMATPAPHAAQNADGTKPAKAFSETAQDVLGSTLLFHASAQQSDPTGVSASAERRSAKALDLQENRARLPKRLQKVYDDFYARVVRYECFTIDFAHESFSYKDFHPVTRAMLNDHPELWLFFFSDESVHDETYKGSPRYIEISYRYNWCKKDVRFSGKAMDLYLRRINRACDRILAKMPAGASRTEQYRYLCDALSKTTKYKDGGLLGWRTAYANGPLLYGAGVCQAYAQAYQWLCHRAGLSCVLAESFDLCHTWNLVQLENGATYHVDVTWYDAEPGCYFLFTEKEAQAHHYPDADTFVATGTPLA